MRLTPLRLRRVSSPVLHHVFVNFLLQIHANGSVGANNLVGADSGVRGHVSAWIIEMDVRGNVLHRVIGALYRRSNEHVKKVPTRISARRSSLCGTEDCRSARAKQRQAASF